MPRPSSQQYTVWVILENGYWTLDNTFGHTFHKKLDVCKDIFAAQCVLRKGFKDRYRIVEIQMKNINEN